MWGSLNVPLRVSDTPTLGDVVFLVTKPSESGPFVTLPLILQWWTRPSPPWWGVALWQAWRQR